MSKKTENILIRVTPEEKEMIKNKAKENKTTITALVLNSIENNITINLDTSDYDNLVIQFKRIGNNINNIIRKINFSYFITDNDLLNIEKNLKQLQRQFKDESIAIRKTTKYYESLTPRKIQNTLERQNKRVPMYLIYEEITDHIILKMRSFIDLVEKEKLNDSYPTYIEYFLKSFIPTEYSYDELVDLSDDLEDIFYRINQKVNTRTGKLTDKDFIDVMEVLKKHKKKKA